MTRHCGPYIAKADAATGTQVWRTYVDNPNVSDRWIGNANLNILPDGNIAFAWSHFIALVDGDTGEILQTNTLPGGDAPIEDVNFKHLTIAPDGTLILKDQTRPLGCTLPGTIAIIDCAGQGMKSANSVLVAVDPDAGCAGYAPAAGTGTLAPYRRPAPRQVRGLWAMGARWVGISGIRRPRQLSADPTGADQPLVAGQQALTAPTVVGDWIAVQTNGLFSTDKASSVVVFHKDDVDQDPFDLSVRRTGPCRSALRRRRTALDPENNMIYSADMGMRKWLGSRLTRQRASSTAFVLDDISSTFQPVFGPADKRVLVLTNVKLPVAIDDPPLRQ